jgi:large subunit ribosomal protein L9
MKVVLKKDVPTLGRSGEVKEVADGYARNFLIPKKLAAVATRTEIANVEAQRSSTARSAARTDAENRELAERMQANPVTVRAKTGEGGRLYGSITGADVAEALTKSLGRDIDKRTVEIDEHIRSLGEHQAKVHIAHGITATVKVNVEAE